MRPSLFNLVPACPAHGVYVMLKSIKDSPLYKIANPGSIAFLGASNNFMSMGTQMLDSVKLLGFEGAVYPVHPKEASVLGFKAYPSIADLPEVPDLAVIVLPTKIVSEIIAACGQKGIKHAIVVSGGFREVGGNGIALQAELQRTAAAHGVRLLGPNCLGVANVHHRFNPTPIPCDCAPGFVGLASQSGSFITQIFNYLQLHSMGFSTAFSVGNELNIDMVDCLEYLGACPDTKVIALYIEGLRRGREFVKTARSIVPHKPIVALYVGGSESGRQAAFSHTGAMAGPDRLYDGILRQSGIIRATSLTELFDFCWALGSQPRPKGSKVVVQTHSGGPGATAADSCGRAGLALASLKPETVEKLRPFVPHTASVKNPIDLTFNKNMQDFYWDIPKILLEDENTDMLMLYFLSPPIFIERFMTGMGMSAEQAVTDTRKIINDQSDTFIRLADSFDKPIIGYTYRSLQEQFVRNIMDHGIPVYPDPARAAKALGALRQYARFRETIMNNEPSEC